MQVFGLIYNLSQCVMHVPISTYKKWTILEPISGFNWILFAFYRVSEIHIYFKHMPNVSSSLFSFKDAGSDFSEFSFLFLTVYGYHKKSHFCIQTEHFSAVKFAMGLRKI